MPSPLLAPLLTEKDDTESSEGGIDPLGTEPLADRLALKLVPGVRERQRHPRFLTAIASSLWLCSEFSDEALARDGVTEPWLVWEWYLVEGMVRTLGSTPDAILGLPGRDKASSAIGQGVPLSAKRYLKTPVVFGFHGIYRLLAKALDVDQGGQLGERGCELLRIWTKDQNLNGFIGADRGSGAYVRKQLREALRDGLDEGSVARGNGWSGWRFFAEHLAPYRIGRRESQFLRNALYDDSTGFRRAVLEFLVTAEGQRLWERESSELKFHEALGTRATADLRRLLRGIKMFERFARLAQDGFDDCLWAMTRKRGKVSPLELGRLASVKLASEKLPTLSDRVTDSLEPLGEAPAFQQRFATLADPGTPTQWVDRLLEHHRCIQKQKPPSGKNPWIERFDDGCYVVRPLYRRTEQSTGDDKYVHLFRTNSLWSFASDLKLVRT
jgi:hypothetical protein